MVNRMRVRGPGEVTALAFVRLKEALTSSRVLIFLVRDAGGETREKEGLEVVEATAADADRYARAIGTESPTTFKARLSESTRCYLVVADGLVVHATWMTTAAAWTREVRRYFRPPPGDAYVYESFTRPEVRGRGVYPWALTNIAARLGAAGIRRLWIGVETDNEPSLRAVSKAGFQPVCEVAYQRRLGRLTVGDPIGESPADCRGLLVLTVQG